jgi:uncharacterized protein YerC
MTKVSRLPLRGDVWDRVFNLFIDTTLNFKNKESLTSFVNDLYAPTEKIMLAKRLAAAVLLAKGHDYQSIKKVLRISDPTIAKISMKVKYSDGGLKKAVEKILLNQASQIVWKEVEAMFDLPAKGNLKSPERFIRSLNRKKEISRIKNTF